MYGSSAQIAVTDSFVQQNRALYSCGGGLAFTLSIVQEQVITNTVISANNAKQGGGACLFSARAAIFGSTLSSNAATSSGGGLRWSAASELRTDTATRIANNTALTGAGALCQASRGTLGASLEGNRATGAGGGLHMSFCSLEVSPAAMIHNNSAESGG